MAHTEYLPIYKANYALCLYLEQVVRQFSRYHKYTLGSDLRDSARTVLKCIVRANARSDKIPFWLRTACGSCHFCPFLPAGGLRSQHHRIG